MRGKKEKEKLIFLGALCALDFCVCVCVRWEWEALKRAKKND